MTVPWACQPLAAAGDSWSCHRAGLLASMLGSKRENCLGEKRPECSEVIHSKVFQQVGQGGNHAGTCAGPAARGQLFSANDLRPCCDQMRTSSNRISLAGNVVTRRQITLLSNSIFGEGAGH